MISEDCIIREYSDLIETLVRRRHALGLSQFELGQRAGLHDGYTGKLESWATHGSGRKLGPISMPILFGALGVAIVVVTDAGEVLPRTHGRLFNRKALQPPWPNPEIVMAAGKIA